jgi:hypothetical protein
LAATGAETAAADVATRATIAIAIMASARLSIVNLLGEM